MTYDQAKARLAHFLTEPVAIIETQFSPAQLEARAKWLKDFAFHCDELLHAVASDSSQHLGLDRHGEPKIKTKYLISVFQDALHECDLTDVLTVEAAGLTESLREEELERA